MISMCRLTRGGALAAIGLVAAASLAHATPTSGALVRQGQQALAKGDYDTARRSFEEAVVADPNDANAFGNLGVANQRLGAVDKAWRNYRNALEIEPNNAWIIAGSGDLDVAIGRIDSAKKKLDHLREVCGTCADYQRLDGAINKYAAKQAKAGKE